MEIISEGLRQKCHRICYNYLGGTWKTVTAEDISIEKFTTGYINLTLKVSLPSGIKPTEGEPANVVIKIDLGLVVDSSFKRMNENIIAVALAQKGLAPKVYGIFEDGRLDEYIESRNLGIKDLENPLIVEALARKIAHLHSQDIPINKDPNKYAKYMIVFLEAALNDPRNLMNDPKRNLLLNKLVALNLREELNWLNKLILSVNAPVVYCHGDYQVNNILLPPNFPIQTLYIVDFDGSGYAYRGSDFASLFHSYCLVLPYPDPPYVKCDWNNFPSLDLQKFIIGKYLDEFQKINKINLNVEEEEKQILRESEIFSLSSVFGMTLYSFGRNDNDKQVNKLDWLEFSDMCLFRYLDLKNKLLENTLYGIRYLKI